MQQEFPLADRRTLMYNPSKFLLGQMLYHVSYPEPRRRQSTNI
jgi:hypothetical protein